MKSPEQIARRRALLRRGWRNAQFYSRTGTVEVGKILLLGLLSSIAAVGGADEPLLQKSVWRER